MDIDNQKGGFAMKFLKLFFVFFMMAMLGLSFSCGDGDPKITSVNFLQMYDSVWVYDRFIMIGHGTDPIFKEGDTLGTVEGLTRHYLINIQLSDSSERHAYADEIKSVRIENTKLAKARIETIKTRFGTVGAVLITGKKMGVTDITIKLKNGIKIKHKLVVQFNLTGVYKNYPPNVTVYIYQLAGKNIIYLNYKHKAFKFVPNPSMNLKFFQSVSYKHKITIHKYNIPLYIEVKTFRRNNSLKFKEKYVKLTNKSH